MNWPAMKRPAMKWPAMKWPAMKWQWDGPRGWSLRRRATMLAGAVATLLLLIAIAVGVTATANRSQVGRMADRLSPAVTASQQLLTAAVSQESAVRGFAIGGRPDDLEPYEQGKIAEAVARTELASLLAGEDDLLRAVDAIGVRLAQWRSAVADPVIAAVLAGGPEAVVEDPRLTDRSGFETITQAITALQLDLRTLREEIRDEVGRTGDALILLVLGAAVVVLFAGTAFALLLRKFVTKPVTDLAAEVRLVARGDYDHVIGTKGPPEVARLVRDVEAMRQRIASDLSAVRHARAALEAANLQLEQQAEELMRSNRDLEQFAYVASHDLQEPLRKVVSFCQLLQRRYAGQLDEKADQYIAFAVAGAQRMQRLINDLLAFSRIGRTESTDDVDLNTAIAEAASQIEAARDRITWDELPVVRGAEQLLIRLLTNLIGNSAKFARAGEPLKVHVSVQPTPSGEWEFACTDNGIGIEAEFADKVFVIFQRLHPRDAYPGTGIGLAIAKKIVEYHGGRIWVDTEYDSGGASIKFTLPMSVPAESSAGKELEEVAT